MYLRRQFRVMINYSNIWEGKKHIEIDFVLNSHVEFTITQTFTRNWIFIVSEPLAEDNINAREASDVEVWPT